MLIGSNYRPNGSYPDRVQPSSEVQSQLWRVGGLQPVRVGLTILETRFRDDVFGPIDDSTSPFDAVARVLCAGLPGLIFHRVLSREECSQLTYPLAALRS